MYSEMGTIDGLTIAMVGDLKHGRTVHSLARLLSLYNVKMYFVAPENLQMPEDVVSGIDSGANGASIHFVSAIEEIIEDCDVVYVTRLQKVQQRRDWSVCAHNSLGEV